MVAMSHSLTKSLGTGCGRKSYTERNCGEMSGTSEMLSQDYIAVGVPKGSGKLPLHEINWGRPTRDKDTLRM